MAASTSTTGVAQLKRELIISNVLSRIALGDKIGEACENSGIAVSTWYLWRRRGYIDPFIAQIREGLEAELAGKVQGKWGDVVELLLSDASDKGAEVRDRDKSRRTLLQTLKAMNLLPSEVDEGTRGEPAREWLAKHSGAFPPVTINVAGDVVATKNVIDDSDEEIVEGEAIERRARDFSPKQVRFPVVAVEP